MAIVGAVELSLVGEVLQLVLLLLLTTAVVLEGSTVEWCAVEDKSPVG